MEYNILDELQAINEKRKEKIMDSDYFLSQINEIEKPWAGSSEFIRLFVFKNFIDKSGNLINLLIVIRDVPTGKELNGFKINDVEASIFQIGSLGTDIKLSQAPKPPEIHPDDEKFIIEKRSLPKKPYDTSVAFDPDKHKWSTMQLAEHLHISNRTVGAYCKAHNI